jgi:hypothetical protein
MSQGNSMEKTRLRDRMRDISTLFVFVVLSALASLIVMDILVLPVALFAVAKKNTFNFILGDLAGLFVIALLAFLLVRRVLALRKEGLSPREILNHIVNRPFSAFATALMVIIAASVLIGVIYLLLSYNNYFIYKLIN